MVVLFGLHAIGGQTEVLDRAEVLGVTCTRLAMVKRLKMVKDAYIKLVKGG